MVSMPSHALTGAILVFISQLLLPTQALSLTNSSELLLNYTARTSSSPSDTDRSEYTDSYSSSRSDVSSVKLGDYIASGLGLGGAPTQAETSSSNTSSVAPLEEVCWSQWEAYCESAASSTQSTYSQLFTATSYKVYTTTYPSPVVGTTVITWSENEHAYRTETHTYTSSNERVEEPTHTYTTWINPVTEVPAFPDLSTPKCHLPTSLARCQSQWDDWVMHQTAKWLDFNATLSCSYFATDTACAAQNSASISFYSSWRSAQSAPSPACTQALVEGSACDALRSSFTSRQGLQTWQTTSSGYAWPATKSLAAGCTVGCQACRITGGQVELIYWPPTSTANLNASRTIDTAAIVTAHAFNTTFTSPTVYISFDSLYASDSCSGIGTTYHNTIIAITNPTELSSIWGWNTGLYLYSASFNFTYLYVTPVPDIIYNRQPRCASAYGVCKNNGFCKSGFVCDVDSKKDFRPRLVVPSEVRGLDPAWATCLGSLEGVYDPPQALKPATVIAVPTKGPDLVQAVSAEPETRNTAPAPITFPPSSAEQPTTRASVPAKSEVPVGQSPPDESNQPINDPSTQASSVANVVSSSRTGSGSNNQPAAVPGPDQAPTRNQGNVAASSTSLIEPGPPAMTGAKPDSDDDPGLGPGKQPQKTQQLDKTRSVDALSVLSEALISLASPSRTNGVQPQQNPAESPNVKTIALPSTKGATVTWTANGQTTYTASREGNAVIVTESTGQSVTITKQGSATLGGQTASIVPGGVAVQAAGNPTGSSPTLTATWTASGKTYTAVRTGDVVRVTSSAGQFVVLTASGTASLDEQTFKIIDGSLVVNDSRTIAFSVMTATATLAAVWIDDGHTFSAMQQNSNIIVVEGSQTYTIRPGFVMTVNGQFISAPASAPVIVVEGSQTLSISAFSESSPLNEQILTLGNHLITIFGSGNSAFLYDGSTTVTGERGDTVTIDGEVISIPSSGDITSLVQLDDTATASDASPTGAATTGATYTGIASLTTKTLCLAWMAFIVTFVCLLATL